MKKLHQFIILISLIGIVIVFSACIRPFKGRVVETSFTGDYDYRLLIRSSTNIYNLTLYLPLPIRNGTPKIGNLLLTSESFSDESFVLYPLSPQSNFRFVIEDLNDIPFLKITADTMIPNQDYQFHYNEYIHTPAYTYLVNTRYPLGNESALLPKFNLSEYVNTPAEINYTTVIYADYRMESSGRLDIMEDLMASQLVVPDL